MPLLREIRDLIAPFAIFGRINECGDLNKCIKYLNLNVNKYFFN